MTAVDDVHVGLLISGIQRMTSLLEATTTQERLDGFKGWHTYANALAASPTFPLQRLRERIKLTDFELRCLLLGLGAELTPTEHAAAPPRPTVKTAVDCLCETVQEADTALAAFSEQGALVRYRLMRTHRGAGFGGVMSRALSLSSPCLAYLLEEEQAPTLKGFVEMTHPKVSLLDVILDGEQQRQVRELVEQHGRYREVVHSWGLDAVVGTVSSLCLLISGVSGTGKTLLARALAAHIKRPLLRVNATEFASDGSFEPLLQDIFCDAVMRDAVVLIDECEALLGRDDKRRLLVMNAIERFEGIVVLTSRAPETVDASMKDRIMFHVPLVMPDAAMREQIWEVHLPAGVPLAGDIDVRVLANSFDFSGGTIRRAVLLSVNAALSANASRPVISMDMMMSACRSQLRYALEALTVREQTHLTLADIVLPEQPTQKIEEIIAAIRNQATVMNMWGFGAKLVTGKGITVLFDGPPGTGKTFCAEVIAGELERPLYRVNIPEVVSKWVGETEKNISAIFQQARVAHAMLLFDEADSLFSARVSETKSSNDRNANMEVNLLLQEIERFPGICILTTNFFGALDEALIRRIQFRVQFEEPDAEQRARIWEILTPQSTPRASCVNYEELGEDWELTGGMIKNALLRTAYWACDAGSPLTRKLLYRACEEEYRAAGRVTRSMEV